MKAIFVSLRLIMKSNKNRLILIAEDDPDDQFLLTEAFKMNGYEGILDFANDGMDLIKRATDLIEENDYLKWPGLIVLDLNMPIKSGYDVLRELKSHATLSKIPVIILSTTGNENQMKLCQELGANAYIRKPNSFKELMSLVLVPNQYLGG